MRIMVFARPVHNPALPINPSPSTRIEDLNGYQPIPNPMDEMALEAALGLRENCQDSATVQVCSTGGQLCRAMLQELLSSGATEALCLEQNTWEPDGMLVAGVLAHHYRSEPFDLGLFGARDLDTGAGQVGPMFSVLTGLPYVDSVIKVQWTATRQIEVVRQEKRIRERLRITLPACLGILRGRPLRYPSLYGKLRAEQTPVRLIPYDSSPPPMPKVQRKKFTPAKPRKGSAATGYSGNSGADRIRQAYGFTGKPSSQKEDSLMRGTPEEVCRQVFEIWKKEKLLDQ